MKKYGNTNSEGLCTVKNPYPYEAHNPEHEVWYAFDRAHPALPLYTTSGHIVKDAENVEVELQHQYEPQDEDYFEWRDCTKSFYDNIREVDNNYKNLEPTRTRQIYRLLTVPPTEMEGIDMSDVPTTPMKIWYKELGNRLLNTEPSTMPSKGIKSAEHAAVVFINENKDNNLKPFDYFIAGFDHAQFATEAGGYTRKDVEIIIKKVVKDCCIAFGQPDVYMPIQPEIYLNAPSNNSSSEMVEEIENLKTQLMQKTAQLQYYLDKK